jgi:integrase
MSAPRRGITSTDFSLKDHPSISEWAAEWMGLNRVVLKPKTIVTYEGLLRTNILPTFGDQSVDLLGRREVMKWIGDMCDRGISSSRIRQSVILLSTMLQSAVDCELAPTNPCFRQRIPKQVLREPLILTAKEVERLADAMPKQYRALIYVLAYGGLRWGEVTALRRSNCNLSQAVIRIVEAYSDVNGRLVLGEVKGRRRYVAIPKFLASELAEHMKTRPSDPDALAFVAPHGGPLRSANFRRRVWWPALHASALPHEVRIHDLRHTAASFLIASGSSPLAVQRHLGHAFVTTTLRIYGHLFPEFREDIAARLDAIHAAAV